MRKQFINANIFGRHENSFIVNNGTFESFGITENIETIDLLGKDVLPGFFDTHLHVVGLGYNKSIVSLVGLDVDDIIENLKTVEKDWIIGRGWHQNNLTKELTKQELDKISKDKPVVAIRVCGHVLIANSKAIELTGITSEEYTGGTINLASGEFTEDALAEIYNLMPENNVERIKEMILLSQKDLLKAGITCVGSDDFSMLRVKYEDVLQAYKELDASGELKLRIVQQVNLPEKKEFKEFIQKGYANQKWNKYMNGPMKLLLDGSLGGQTAFMAEPYEGTNNVGVHTFTQGELNEMISICEKAGMSFAIHAIGDGAVDLILKAPKSKMLHGIIHAQFLNQAQIDQCLSQDISIYAQPVFLNSDIPIIKDLVGDRYKESYIFKSMQDKGLLVSFSTDAPIESISPFENIFVAMKRTMLSGGEPFLTEESFSFEESVRCYSENGYKQVGVCKNGSLKENYVADFIVCELSENIKDSIVLETYIDGEKI